MVLLADMGNTNVTVAGWGDSGRVFELRLPTDHSWDGAAYTKALREGLAEAGQADARFEGAALCSVVPPLNEAVCAALQAVCGSTPVQLNRRGNTGGVDIFTDDPDEVGNDLLAGAIAATALTPMPAIVADLGTATTFTAQDKHGNILGVSIAPGVAMGLEALAGRASQLFSVAIQGPKAAIGTNTVASLQSGVVLGAAALLDGMADRMEEELNGEATLVVTGGLAPVVLPYCRRKAIHAPDLVLEGLYRYWQLNR